MAAVAHSHRGRLAIGAGALLAAAILMVVLAPLAAEGVMTLVISAISAIRALDVYGLLALMLCLSVVMVAAGMAKAIKLTLTEHRRFLNGEFD